MHRLFAAGALLPGGSPVLLGVRVGASGALVARASVFRLDAVYMCVCVCVHMCVYIYIYIEREREREIYTHMYYVYVGCCLL